MRTKMILMLVVLAAMSDMVSGQIVRLREGSLDALKGVKRLNVQYVYDGMTVSTKSVPENEFVLDKTEEYNKKTEGKGDSWARSWVEDRKRRFEPRFKESFEAESDMRLGTYADAKYTLIFKTTHTETGFNIGISRRNAYIDGEALIVETSNPGNVIARITVDNAPGRIYGGFDFDTGTRLQEAYAMAGKRLAKYIGKKID